MGYRIQRLFVLLMMILVLTSCKKRTLTDYREELNNSTEENITEKDTKEYFLVYNFNTQKVTEDIEYFFNIYDESSYKNAKLNLKYTESCELHYYFSNADIINLTTEFSGKPTINIVDITQDLDNTSDTQISYVVSVDVSYQEKRQSYLVILVYDKDYQICKFERFLLT